jgi:sulfite exporter TauE/SafE
MLALVLSAAATGFATSAHCAAMCGPFACGAGLAPRQRAAFHSTRIGSYAAEGALAGVLGRSAFESFTAPVAQSVALAVAAGLLIAALATARAALRPTLRPSPRPSLGARPGPAVRWAHRCAALMTRLPLPRPVGFGLINALFPCGLLYSALGLAAATRDPAWGAMAMAAFGLSTAPALILGAGLLGRLRARGAAGDGRALRFTRLLAAGGLAVGALLLGTRAWGVGTDETLPCHGTGSPLGQTRPRGFK